MKKATRLLLLTAFAFPILLVSKAYAGPGPGQRGGIGTGQQISPIGQNDPYASNDPYRLQDPSGQTGTENSLDRGLDNDPFADHDSYPGATGGPNDDGSNGNGGTAPLDGGISILLAAGLALGAKKARDRHKSLGQKDVEQDS